MIHVYYRVRVTCSTLEEYEQVMAKFQVDPGLEEVTGDPVLKIVRGKTFESAGEYDFDGDS